MNCAEAGCKEMRGTTCHCAGCHNTFGSLKLFDGHQSVTYGKTVGRVVCKDPAKQGFVLDAWGTWRTPENLVATANRVAAMNTARFERQQNEEAS
jgi:hypothetical protein